MADSTRLPFYGLVQIPIQIRDVKLEKIFLVSQINQDAILGMPFLMVSCVQTVRKTTIPLQTEAALSCRVTSHNHPPEWLTEDLSDKVVLASSINRPGAQGDVIVRCINSTDQPLELATGLTIGTFTSIGEQDITKDRERKPGSERQTSL